MTLAHVGVVRSLRSAMGRSMHNDAIFQSVTDLHLPLGTFALFGSAPLGVRGLRECRDIDVIVTEELWNEQKNKGWETVTMPHGSIGLVKGEIELWKNWYPGDWDVPKLIREAEMIAGLPFVRLEEVLKWKKLMNREKDLKDIEAINAFLKQQQNDK